jgi:hypothetical protein
MSGFFFEISKGAICAGNVFLNCDNGSLVLNSSDVEFYQNTYINSKIAIGRDKRNATNDHFGWHPATGPDVDERDEHVFMNNLIVKNDIVQNPLLEVWQAEELCDSLSKLQLNQLDHNVYIDQSLKDITPKFVWSTVKEDPCEYEFNTITEINEKHSIFSANSLYFKDYAGPLFQDVDEKNLRLSNDFPGVEAAGALRDTIKLLLDTKPAENIYIGAYPLFHTE